MPSETTTDFVRLLVFFRIRRGTFPYGDEDDASTISLTPTTNYTNICVKLTIVTHLSFSERIAIANLSLLFSTGRYGRVYRLWVSASSGAYQRAVWGGGPRDVYRTVFCPTLRSLNVRTYFARVPPPPTSCYTALSIYTNSRVSAGVILSGPC